jgi:hypothetical protein
MKSIFLLYQMAVMFVLVSCATLNVDKRRQTASSIAGHSNFKPFNYQGAMFNFFGYIKEGTDASYPIVYIEGDGFSWVNKHTVSPNPTPKNPVALRLAAIDTSSSVIYMARPCQFVDLENEKNCRQDYWTNARFAPEVIQGFDTALNDMKHRYGSIGFHLVGFSGGGSIAVLLASVRDDIQSVRTVAGNLDHVALHRDKGVSQLTKSLNPIDVAQRTNNISQMHFSGQNDRVVPSWVTQNFVRAADNPKCVKMNVISNTSHAQGWEKMWPSMHQSLSGCSL